MVSVYILTFYLLCCVCVREGNGTPLQYFCLENPMDGGAWWAVVHGVTKSRTWQRLHFCFSLSCIGEGNGNPLQCSCLENPTDGGTWWAAISGVAQSWTRLKRLSSSSYQLPFPLLCVGKGGECLRSVYKKAQRSTLSPWSLQSIIRPC